MRIRHLVAGTLMLTVVVAAGAGGGFLAHRAALDTHTADLQQLERLEHELTLLLAALPQPLPVEQRYRLSAQARHIAALGAGESDYLLTRRLADLDEAVGALEALWQAGGNAIGQTQVGAQLQLHVAEALGATHSRIGDTYHALQALQDRALSTALLAAVFVAGLIGAGGTLLHRRVVDPLQRIREALSGAHPERVTALEPQPVIELDAVREALTSLTTRLRGAVDQQRRLAHQLIEAQETERRHLALELHDQLGQTLTATRLRLDLPARAGETPEASLATARDAIDQAIALVRGLARDLRPSILDDLGLVAALEWYCETQSQNCGTLISCELGAPDISGSDPRAIVLFRITQEAVTNALRHAEANHVAVRLATHARGLALTVSDNGLGFDPRAVESYASMGLLGMRERAALLGGYVEIASGRGRGTQVDVFLPHLETAA